MTFNRCRFGELNTICTRIGSLNPLTTVIGTLPAAPVSTRSLASRWMALPRKT